jgi:hypothetical protein
MYGVAVMVWSRAATADFGVLAACCSSGPVRVVIVACSFGAQNLQLLCDDPGVVLVKDQKVLGSLLGFRTDVVALRYETKLSNITSPFFAT